MEPQCSHYMQLPREIMIGRGVLNRLIAICKGLGFSRSVFVLTGPKVYKIIAKRIIDQLKASYIVTYSIIKVANISTVMEVMDASKEGAAEVILGIGGGTVIDVAKTSATYNSIPFISIPTAASHDGISSPRASLKGMNKPTSIQVQAPIAILADTEIISNSPAKLTAAGCGDIIAKYTAVNDWELAFEHHNEYYGEYAANLALMSAKLIMKNAEIISKNGRDGLRIVLEALISCGVAISIAGSSRPCSGSEHLFSHALDQLAPKPALHGEQCGVGAIMMAYLQKRDWKTIRNKLKILGAPVTAEELQIEDEYIIEALTQAHRIRPDRYTILGKSGLTRKEAEELAHASKVIS